MSWFERVTESRAFKRIDNPATALGAVITAAVALAFGITAHVQNPNTERDCQTNPLRGVYNPARLTVVQRCATIDVTIRRVSKERDGDLHIGAAAAAEWLRPKNVQRQHGDLVVEYMPGDGYPRPRVGDRLRLTCTFVLDRQHGGWSECHPVWRVAPLGAAAERVVP